jgi:YVTN family beta-propeller protein
MRRVRTRFAAVLVIALATLPLLRTHAVAQMVIATIPVAGQPVGVATNPMLNRIYVAAFQNNRVAVIDGATNTIIATVPLGSSPLGVAVNATTNRIYVTHPTTGNVSVIDGGTNTVITTISVGNRPGTVDVDSTRNRIYVTVAGAVAEIDGATNTVVATIPLGGSEIDVATHPMSNRLYGLSQDKVSVIDTTTRAIVATVSLPLWQLSLAVNPTRNRIYVTGPRLTVIDGANNTVRNTVSQPGFATTRDSVAVNPLTHRVYVAAYNFNEVHIFDGTTNSFVVSVPVGMSPHSVATVPSSGRVYVSNLSSDTVAVIQDLPASVVPPDSTPPHQCVSWLGKNLFLCGPRDAPLLPHCPQRPFTDPLTACPPLDPHPPLCHILSCPPCLLTLTCTDEPFELLFDSHANDLELSVFDRDGKERSRMEALEKPVRVGRDNFNQRLRFRAEPGVSYYLGVVGGANTRSDVGHNLRLHLRPDKP